MSTAADGRVVSPPAWAASLTAAGTASTVTGASRARRVLKSPTIRAVPTAEQARAEAEAKARAEAQRLGELRQAAEAGRAEGYRAGVEETLASGQEAGLRGASALERVLAKVDGMREREVHATAEGVVTAALEIAEWVLRRELSDEGRSLLTRLETGLTSLLPSPSTRIAVSHADHAVVAQWAEARGRVGTTVVADARLTPGDAVVVTDAGSADLTVAAALKTAADALGLTPTDETTTPEA